MGNMRNAYKILAGVHVGKRPLISPRCRCKDKMKIDVK